VGGVPGSEFVREAKRGSVGFGAPDAWPRRRLDDGLPVAISRSYTVNRPTAKCNLFIIDSFFLSWIRLLSLRREKRSLWKNTA
jgi:hypothetical protein